MEKGRIRALAEELLILLTAEEEAQFGEEIAYFRAQSDLLGKIEGIDDVEPMIFPYNKETTYLREDIVDETPSREEILKNSKNAKDAFVVIPKVVKK